MPTASDDLREQARRLYVDTGMLVDDIGRQVGRTGRTIQSWAHQEGWRRRTAATAMQRARQATSTTETHPAPRPRQSKRAAARQLSLHERCCRLFDQFLSSLEDRMSTDDPNAEPLSERDVRALSGFSRAIEKIKEIEPGHDPAERGATRRGTAAPAECDEEDRLRRELVDRLLKLRERKRAEDAARGAGGET